MRVLFKSGLMVLLSIVAQAAWAVEHMTVSTWPSAVTTLIVHADGSGAFLCNGTNGKTCHVIILNEGCMNSAHALPSQPGACHPDQLGHFELELGKSKEFKALPVHLQYCASATEPIAIPACLMNVKNIAVPPQ